MTNNQYYRQKFYILDLCFACKERLLTPLHSLQQRHLGMPRVHQRCFLEALFDRFDSETIITVSRNDVVIEQIPLAHWPTRDHGTRYIRDTLDPEDDD